MDGISKFFKGKFIERYGDGLDAGTNAAKAMPATISIPARSLFKVLYPGTPDYPRQPIPQSTIHQKIVEYFDSCHSIMQESAQNILRFKDAPDPNHFAYHCMNIVKVLQGNAEKSNPAIDTVTFDEIAFYAYYESAMNIAGLLRNANGNHLTQKMREKLNPNPDRIQRYLDQTEGKVTPIYRMAQAPAYMVHAHQRFSKHIEEIMKSSAKQVYPFAVSTSRPD